MGERPRRERLDRTALARGVRRGRPRPDGAVHLQARTRDGRSARGRRPRRDDVRPDADRARQRGAEGALPASNPRRRCRVGAGLLGARLRLGPRLAADLGGSRRRRVRDQRAEDLDLGRARLGLALPARAHRPRGAEAPRHLLHDRRRHPHQRPAGPPARRHGLAARVQRDLLRGRAHARDPRRRRGQPRLVRRHDADGLRALRRGRRRPPARRPRPLRRRTARRGALAVTPRALPGAALRRRRALRRDRGGLQLLGADRLDARTRASCPTTRPRSRRSS